MGVALGAVLDGEGRVIGWREQRRVLAARYRDVLLGDPGTLLILVGQAPLIGWLCAVVWGSVETDTPSLYFVMALASGWVGCIAACREVVRERAIIERERFFGVSPPAVILSKAEALFALGLAQVVLLQGAVEWKLSLKGPYLLQTAALALASWAGVGLGLLVSSIAASQERAVAAVPLLLLPQVLFSEMAVPRRYFTDAVAVVEKFMPVRWTYRIFVDMAEPEAPWGTVALSFGVLALYVAALCALATLALWPRREA